MDRVKILDDMYYENTSRYNKGLDWSHPKFVHESSCWDNTKRSAHIKLHIQGFKFWYCPQFMKTWLKDGRYLEQNRGIPRFLDWDGYPISEYHGLVEGCDNA